MSKHFGTPVGGLEQLWRARVCAIVSPAFGDRSRSRCRGTAAPVAGAPASTAIEQARRGRATSVRGVAGVVAAVARQRFAGAQLQPVACAIGEMRRPFASSTLRLEGDVGRHFARVTEPSGSTGA